MNELQNLFQQQTNNRWRISQTACAERILKLKKLKAEVIRRRGDIALALNKDFKKPFAESELTEIHPVIDEINFTIRHLKKWMKPKSVKTPVVLFGSRSKIQYEARGVVLILSPWNYPFSLLLNPLTAAVSAGNCAICRPSEKTPNTARILKEIIEAVFKADEVALVIGDVDVAEKLLLLAFDHIFFTGSTNVGKKVMAAAATNLATVTLELGGKSPAIIDRDVDLSDAAKKLAWGKYMNGGQTCVAPDYLFVPEDLKDQFIELFTDQVKNNFGKNSIERKQSPDFARLIDQESFRRLSGKIQNEKDFIGDEFDSGEHYLSPVLLETNLSSPIMEDEIFGPILPIITYNKLEEVITHIQGGQKPLALYIFSRQKQMIEYVLSRTTSGGVGINQVILHLANPYLPFGGVGHSGQGSYHGHFGFKTFSHERSILIQSKVSLISLYFPPYTTWISRMAFKLLRLFE
ncbi:MAG: aldehyde dehydrogenase family protein [Bacteriovorax sp.]|jgi:aldehyde dehydrogenase (NAD+)